jgi:hypothetical protein
LPYVGGARLGNQFPASREDFAVFTMCRFSFHGGMPLEPAVA